jgi:hypothetical protein
MKRDYSLAAAAVVVLKLPISPFAVAVKETPRTEARGAS